MDCILYLVKCGKKDWRLFDDPENPGFSYDFLTMKEAIIWAGNNSYAVFYLEKGKWYVFLVHFIGWIGRGIQR
jgi:hypothetical protein